jgi:hypothetical protein
MEENNSVDLATKYLLSTGLDSNQETESIIFTIYTLLKDSEEKSLFKEEALNKVPHIKKDTSSYKHYALYNSYFSLHVDSSVEEYIESSFKHLLTKNSNTSIYHFDVLYEDNSYNIYANGIKQESIEKKENILPILQDFIRIVFYENSDFLVAIHAAVLEHKNKTLIFPGISGAGKSTLSSFLMHHGFILYSDEVTVVDSNYNINSLALCNTIKENSWEVIKHFIKDIDSLHIHHRFDGQSIKFVKPPTTPSDPINAQGAYIFFPTYKKNAQTELKSIDIVEAISLITQAQYHLYNPKDAEVTKSFLSFLTSCKLYTISYSDLKSAQKAIEGVLEDD